MSLSQVPQKWDGEADIIVVGAGNAGLPAATTATDKGAKVIVLEAWSGMASSLAMIAGGTPFAGTDLQKEQGIDDSPDKFCAEAVEISGGSPDLWRAIADRQLETYEWLKSIGARPVQLIHSPGHRVMRAIWFEGHGPGILKVLRKAAEDRGIDLRFKHRAEKLLLDSAKGRVIGVRAKSGGKVLNLRARKAVIITTGGFCRNMELVKEYGPSYIGCIPTAPPTHVGDGLRMALAIGAATEGIGLAVCPSLSVDMHTNRPALMQASGGILVKVDGTRWTNEMPSPPGSYTVGFKELLMHYPSGEHFMIYDSKSRQDAPPERYRHNKEHSADTIEELEKNLGIPAGALKATIDEYNSDIDKYGYDRKFGRRQRGLVDVEEPPTKIDTPPYYAIKCKVCLTSMKGGLKINTRNQVIDQFGDVIPGLYAAGEVAGGLMGIPSHYYTGTMTLQAFTQGRIAGENAANEASN
jgi:flavocytochrome c